MEDLTVECDSIRVHSKTAVAPIIPPIVVAIGVISIFGIILAAATTTSAIPITTGILGGKPIAVKLGTLK